MRQDSSLKLLSSCGRIFILDTTLQEMHTRLLSTPPKNSSSLISFLLAFQLLRACLWHLISRLLQCKAALQCQAVLSLSLPTFCVCLPRRSLMLGVLNQSFGLVATTRSHGRDTLDNEQTTKQNCEGRTRSVLL
jgi:hypothetical protein